MKKPDIANYRNMRWHTTVKEGEKPRSIRIKFMDAEHIRGLQKSIKSNNKVIKIHGYDKQDWLNAFDLELKRREKMADDLFKFITKTFPIAARAFNSITTKGIKNYNTNKQ